MADDNDDVIVEIEAEPQSAVGAGESKPAAVTGDDPVKELKAQFAEVQEAGERDKAARAEAERRAAAAAAEAGRLRGEVESVRGEVHAREYETVTAGLDAAKTEIDAAKRDIKIHGEAGDYDKQSDAYDRLATARARQVRLDEAKAELELRTAARPEQRLEMRASSLDPFEAYLASRSEPTQRWLREHREWVTDPKKNSKLTAAHYDAIGEELVPDSKEYFEHVEKFIGLKPNGAGDAQRAASPRPRRASVPAAPVNASGGGPSGGGTEVRLTKGEAAAAIDGTLVWNYDDPSGQKRFKKGDPIGIQEMARRKLALTQTNQYDKSYTES